MGIVPLAFTLVIVALLLLPPAIRKCVLMPLWPVRWLVLILVYPIAMIISLIIRALDPYRGEVFYNFLLRKSKVPDSKSHEGQQSNRVPSE